MDSTWSRSNPLLTARPARGVQRRWRMHAALALLLAMSVAALVVVADRAIDTWTDGHLFLAWLAGWAVIFAATALLDSWHRQRTAARAAAARAAAQRVHSGGEQANAFHRRAELDHRLGGGQLPYL